VPGLVPADDHSTRTVAVQRIAPGASAPSAILWSQDLGLKPWSTLVASNGTLDVSFFGSSLFVTILDPATSPYPTTASYLAIDTTALH
jgi:hypothetical protein